ncbi:MAG TPA: glycosyltransferase family 39 protein [Candidatus Limnocylindrales bacterium]|nr:glycosyltransferase family 39 protein [Candidatus Limnocylindrales bacterium]
MLLALSVAIVVTAAIVGASLPLRGAIERAAAAILTAHGLVTGSLLVAGVGVRSLDPSAIAVVVLVACATLIGVVVWSYLAEWRVRPALPRTLPGGMRAGVALVPVALLAVVAGASLAWRTLLAIRLPVLDYDGFSYHLVTVDTWLQTNHIGRTPQRIWSDGYPANGELISLWLMAFTRTDDYATLSALLAVPLVVISTVGLARVLGAARMWSVFAGLLVAVVPALVMLTTTTYVDVLAAAYIAAGWFFGVAALTAPAGARRSTLYVLAGLAAGLGIGTKGTLLVPLGAVVFVLLVDAVRRSSVSRATLRDGALVVVPLVAFGGYWYIKNTIVFGNPVWPFTIGPLPGIGTFNDLIVQTPRQLAPLPAPLRILYSWFADLALSSYQFDTRIGGFGIQWPIILVLAVVGVIVAARRYLWPTLAIVVPAAVTLLTMPMSWWPRLTLFVPVLAIALAAVALSRIAASGRRASTAAVVGALAISVVASVSLWRATARFNVGVTPPPVTTPDVGRMARLVATPDVKRSELGLWRDCATLGAIPTSAHVAVDAFNLIHLITGHDLAVVVTGSIPQSADAASLLKTARAAGADHLLLAAGGANRAFAASDPDHFVVVGPACRGSDIVRVR